MDYVLIYDAINDLWMNHVSAEKFRDDYSHARPWYKRNFLLNHSIIARYLYNRILWSLPKCIYSNAWAQFIKNPLLLECYNGANFRAYTTFEGNIRKLIELVRKDNGVPILMTFASNIPANYSKEAFERGSLGYVNPTNYDKQPVELWGGVEYVREGIRQNNLIIRAIAREEHVLLIDQEKKLSDNIRMFGDPVHLSENGTDIFVKNITDFFISEGLLPSCKNGIVGRLE